jgi:O-antigen/teichoic acid export membrane protein
MIATTVLQFVQAVVLARLLTRADFGLMAMVLTVLTFGQIYADMGFSNAIIWRQDSTRNQLSSLYWVNIVAGFVVFLAVLLLTPPVARFFGQPRLAHYLPWAALMFLVVPWGQQFQVLLEKSLRFKVLATIEVAAAGVAAATSILGALAGLGVFALVLGQLASAGTRSAALAVVGWRSWRPELHLRFKDLRGYMRFGGYQMGDRSLNQLTANLDYIVIGRFLGSIALGVYSIAYQLVVLPFQKINPVLTRVAFPVFSLRQSDDEAIGNGYCRISVTLVFVVFPLLVGLLVTAPVAVPVIFGRKWVGAVPLVQVLSVMAMAKTLGNPSGSILLAKGRADLGFLINAVQLAVTLVVFLVVVRFGTLAVAWGWVGISVISLAGWQPVVLRVIGLDWREYVRALARPILLIAVFTLALEPIYLVVRHYVASGWLVLSLVATTGFAIHLGIWLLFDRGFVAAAYAAFRTEAGAVS